MFIRDPATARPQLGSIPRWHDHKPSMPSEMLHVWFTGDVASAYAEKGPYTSEATAADVVKFLVGAPAAFASWYGAMLAAAGRGQG